MEKSVKKIFLVLLFYSLSAGLFYNFQELWMESNNLSIKTIGIVYSICALVSVSAIFLSSNLINQNRLKKFVLTLFIIKMLSMCFLFLLNNSGLNTFIKFFIIIDYTINVEIYASIYPMISMVSKKDKQYALRGIIYEFGYFFAVIFSTVLLNKYIVFVKMTYNNYCLISIIMLFIGYIILKRVDLENYVNKEKNNNSYIMDKMPKIIFKNKILRNYLCYSFFNSISYSCLTGLLLIILINNLNFSIIGASYLKMIIGIISPLIAFIVLNLFTFKNHYVNLSLKFIVRFILYVLAILFNSNVIFLIALMFTKFSAECYKNISDGPFINIVETKYQLAFCNLLEMLSYLSKAIATFICGFSLIISLKLNFVFAVIFTGLGTFFIFKAYYLKQKKEKC